jgi:hypothetical protein
VSDTAVKDDVINEKGEKTCAHSGCSCLMQEEEAFCSDYCESAGADDHCRCQHLACIASSSGQTRT